jgi:hypothetical protein
MIVLALTQITFVHYRSVFPDHSGRVVVSE